MPSNFDEKNAIVFWGQYHGILETKFFPLRFEGISYNSVVKVMKLVTTQCLFVSRVGFCHCLIDVSILKGTYNSIKLILCDCSRTVFCSVERESVIEWNESQCWSNVEINLVAALESQHLGYLISHSAPISTRFHQNCVLLILA